MNITVDGEDSFEQMASCREQLASGLIGLVKDGVIDCSRMNRNQGNHDGEVVILTVFYRNSYRAMVLAIRASSVAS
jgi:hypothetical protein